MKKWIRVEVRIMEVDATGTETVIESAYSDEIKKVTLDKAVDQRKKNSNISSIDAASVLLNYGVCGYLSHYK